MSLNQPLEGTVLVAGGGVIGITSACALQFAGYSVRLVTSSLPFDERRPRVASVHAAASILPHSVVSPSAGRWTRRSMEVFARLAFTGVAGVRRQQHLELFGDGERAVPNYSGVVDQFEVLLPGDLTGKGRLTGTHGWSFYTYFCETPTYLRFLYQLFEQIGGFLDVRVDATEAVLADAITEGHRLVVNCTGASAIAASRAASAELVDTGGAPLFDAAAPRFLRGQYLLLRDLPPLWNKAGMPLSFNFTPGAEEYSGVDGTAADVYCYPRSTDWLLGGTRDEWREGDAEAPLPEQILSLNAEIVLGLSEGSVDLSRACAAYPERMSSGWGLRFMRDDSTDGVRLETSYVEESRGSSAAIVHNYGHGGAGYTLSWGCAFDVVNEVRLASLELDLPNHDRSRSVEGSMSPALGLISDLLAKEPAA